MRNTKWSKFVRYSIYHNIPEDFDWKACYKFWKDKHKIDKRERRIVTEEQSFNIRAKASNLRAKKFGVEGILLSSDLHRIMFDAGRRCGKCQSTSYLVFDHKKPLYKGGLNTPDNIQVLCRKCNMEKGVNEE